MRLIITLGVRGFCLLAMAHARSSRPLPLVNAKVVKLPGAWQVSQAARPIGMWLGGRVRVAGVPAKLRPAAGQVAQAMPLTAACTMAGGVVPLAFAKRNPPAAKFELEWQLSHPALPMAT